MARVPGTFNGGVPPNLEWDEGNPPTKNSCNDQVIGHDKACDGSCEQIPLTRVEMEVINEHREWARVGMNPNAVQANPVVTDVKVEALIEMAGLDRDEFHQVCLGITLRQMRELREQNQENALRAKLGVPPKIIGPDGKPL